MIIITSEVLRKNLYDESNRDCSRKKELKSPKHCFVLLLKHSNKKPTFILI